MSTAILSLEAYEERRLRDRFRTQAHGALDDLLNRLELEMTELTSSPPTLMDLPQAAFPFAISLLRLHDLMFARRGPFQQSGTIYLKLRKPIDERSSLESRDSAVQDPK